MLFMSSLLLSLQSGFICPCSQISVSEIFIQDKVWYKAQCINLNECGKMLMNLQQTLLCSCPQTNRRTLCPAASWNGFMIVLAFISRTSAFNRRSTRWRPRSRWVLRGEEQFHENTRRNTRLKATKAEMYCVFSCVRAAFILNEIKHLVSDSQVDWKHETTQWVQHLIQEIYQTRKMHLDQKDRVVHILMATWCTALFNHSYKTQKTQSWGFSVSDWSVFLERGLKPVTNFKRNLAALSSWYSVYTSAIAFIVSPQRRSTGYWSS